MQTHYKITSKTFLGRKYNSVSESKKKKRKKNKEIKREML